MSPKKVIDIFGREIMIPDQRKRTYLSFKPDVDCLLCDVHIFNMAFEREHYLADDTMVIFVLDNVTKDVEAFKEEHPNFPFYVVFDIKRTLFEQLSVGKKRIIDLFKPNARSHADFFFEGDKRVKSKYYRQDRDHFKYEQISAFLRGN